VGTLYIDKIDIPSQVTSGIGFGIYLDCYWEPPPGGYDYDIECAVFLEDFLIGSFNIPHYIVMQHEVLFVEQIDSVIKVVPDEDKITHISGRLVYSYWHSNFIHTRDSFRRMVSSQAPGRTPLCQPQQLPYPAPK